MGHELVFVALFLVATAVALVARALRVPYTVALVVAGLALGATRALSPPHGSFALAERLHLSGVIATVVAGMICGNYGARTGMSPSTRLAVESFWEYVAFALNSVVFLLLGFEVRLGELLHAWKPVLAAFVVVTTARAVVVALVGLALGRTRERFPASWVAVLTWG